MLFDKLRAQVPQYIEQSRAELAIILEEDKAEGHPK